MDNTTRLISLSKIDFDFRALDHLCKCRTLMFKCNGESCSRCLHTKECKSFALLSNRWRKIMEI